MTRNAPETRQKVLVVNKFYYRRGGDCVYTLGLERLLRARGHDVAVFAMNYGENLRSDFEQYFPAEVSFTGGIGGKLRAAARMLGMGDVRRCFGRLLDDFRPDIVHLNNIHSYLSPVLAEMAKARGARVVWTLHDYKLICPAYTCLRGGKICEDCFRNPRAMVRGKCMKGSLAASLLARIEAAKWNSDRLQRSVDTFICPSAFMAAKMKQAGFDPDKLTVINNFVDERQTAPASGRRGDYFCYAGRLSEEKGVETLIKASYKVNIPLRIAGDGPLLAGLKERYADAPNVSFLGRLDAGGVASLLASARWSVVPSEWYENNPFSVIESLLAGTPVVGADIGGIPELIDESNGLLFTPGDTDGLSDTMLKMAEMTDAGKFDHAAIQSSAEKKFSAEAHYSRLIKIY